jgi:hypothetical protein
MLNRLQDTLTSVISYQPSSGYGSDYYSPTSPLSVDSGYNNNGSVSSAGWQRSPPKYRPPTITNPTEFGWTPQCLIDRKHQQQAPRRQMPPPPTPMYTKFTATPPRSVVEPEPPAWLGSLRPSAESKPSDQRASGF